MTRQRLCLCLCLWMQGMRHVVGHPAGTGLAIATARAATTGLAMAIARVATTGLAMAIARVATTGLATTTGPAIASVAVTSRLAVVSTQQKHMAKQHRQQRHHASHP